MSIDMTRRNMLGMVGAMSIAVVASAACQLWTMRSQSPDRNCGGEREGARGIAGTEPAVRGEAAGSGKRPYRLTPYSVMMLACFGVTWGLSSGLSTLQNAESSMSIAWWALLAIAALACAAIAAVVGGYRAGSIRFGTLIRLSVVAAGAALALTPLLCRVSPELFIPLCGFVFVVEEIAIILFSVDVCQENDLPITRVLPVNHALFAGCACAAALAFWLFQTLAGGQVALEFTAALSTLAILSLIPFLPSRMSDATTFTLDELPENESFDARVAKRRDSLVARYGLGGREAEVLELLFKGMTRQGIADELHLSPWTVKNRIAAIYEKVGVHSYKELMQLVSEDSA